MRGSGTARSLLAHARRVAVPPFRSDASVKEKLSSAVGADEKVIRVDVTNHGPGDVKHGKVSFSTADVPDSAFVAQVPAGAKKVEFGPARESPPQK